MSNFYPHTAFTYCSSANKIGFNVKEAFNKLTEEFIKGYVSYPRTDGSGHGEIIVINSYALSDEVKKIFKIAPNLKEEDKFITGDVYTLAGKLCLSTPASLIKDIEKAKKINPPKKINLYIGLQRKNFIENEVLYVDTKNTSMQLLKEVFEKDIVESKTKIPAFNKEKENISTKIA